MHASIHTYVSIVSIMSTISSIILYLLRLIYYNLLLILKYFMDNHYDAYVLYVLLIILRWLNSSSSIMAPDAARLNGPLLPGRGDRSVEPTTPAAPFSAGRLRGEALDV
jgi:hypothetical protein